MVPQGSHRILLRYAASSRLRCIGASGRCRGFSVGLSFTSVGRIGGRL